MIHSRAEQIKEQCVFNAYTHWDSEVSYNEYDMMLDEAEYDYSCIDEICGFSSKEEEEEEDLMHPTLETYGMSWRDFF